MFPPDCGCTLLRYCCRSRLSQLDVATDDPTEVAQVGWLLVPASLYDVEILELTIVRKSDCPSNWRPIPWEMHPWRRTGWVPEDVTERLSSLLVFETNAGMWGSPYPTGLVYPTTANVETTGLWTRTEETVSEDGRWIWMGQNVTSCWWWMKLFEQSWPSTEVDGIGHWWELVRTSPEGK